MGYGYQLRPLYFPKGLQYIYSMLQGYILWL